MKAIILLLIFSTSLLAQTLSPDEQKKLIEENKMLREELTKSQAAPAQSPQIMDTLKKGQKFQEDQQKALEEIDKED
jgi:hypothetical protein